LVYPENPDTYWSFKHALKFISKKASQIPLGLITVASLLPDGWNRKLIDLNIERLKDKAYYERVLSFLKQYNPPYMRPFSLNKFGALMKSLLYIGVLSKKRIYFWKIFFWSIFNKPKAFPLAITYSIYGYHFRRVFRDVI